MGRLYYWVANWNLTRAGAAVLLGNNVKDMVDCTSSALPKVKACFGTIHVVGAYITGSSDIRWDQSHFNQVPAWVTVLEIDQSNLDLPLFSHAKKIVKDEERGASTIGQAVHVALERLRRGEDYVIYCDQADLSPTEGAARYAGLPHGEIIAYQWASPSSNPNTRLPGTSLNLREANADLTVIRSDYLASLSPRPAPKPRPTPQPPHPPLSEESAEYDTAFNTGFRHGFQDGWRARG